MDIAREPAAEKRGGKAGRVLGIIGTILLIGVVTGLIFVCIFAFYVKTCITPSLDLDLNDFTLNQSSIIYYQDSNGDYQKLTTVKSSENRIWVDGDQIPPAYEGRARRHRGQALLYAQGRRLVPHGARGAQYVHRRLDLRRLDDNAAAYKEPHSAGRYNRAA